MKKQMTLVYYYVPEDKDDPQVPNVFGINVKKDEVRLKNIYDNFPIAGQYIFRFKVLYENNIAWLDLPDPNAKLPTFKDKIMIKASRVSWENKRPNFQTKSASVTANKPVNQNVNSPTLLTNGTNNNKSKDILGSPTSTSVKKQQSIKKPTTTSQSFNLIDEVHLNHHQQNNGKNSDDLI